jgi:hypothetical protein
MNHSHIHVTKYSFEISIIWISELEFSIKTRKKLLGLISPLGFYSFSLILTCVSNIQLRTM